MIMFMMHFKLSVTTNGNTIINNIYMISHICCDRQILTFVRRFYLFIYFIYYFFFIIYLFLLFFFCGKKFKLFQ